MASAIDYDKDIDVVTVKVTKNQDSIMDLWEEYFSTKGPTTVLLSGGIDSQFSAFLAKKYCKDVNALTFLYMWEDNIVNATDYAMALEFSQKHGLELLTEKIDVKNFLDFELLSFANKYNCFSPQVATNMYAISQSKHNKRHLILGGELPTVGKYNNIASCGPFGMHDYGSAQYRKFVIPYQLMAQELKLDMSRDPFVLSDKIIYLGFAQNINVIRDSGIIIDYKMQESGIKKSSYLYKIAFYNSFGFDYTIPLVKRTGFETIKTHLASLTGNYDEFDRRYRKRIDLSITEAWKEPCRIIGDDMSDINEQVNHLIDTCDLETANIYSFDW